MKTRFWTNWALPMCREAWLLSLGAGLVFKPAAVVASATSQRFGRTSCKARLQVPVSTQHPSEHVRAVDQASSHRHYQNLYPGPCDFD